MSKKVFITSAILTFLCLFSSLAQAKTVERDTNEDGVTDRIAHFDARGGLTLLEVDEDFDGKFERRQEYKRDLLVLVKRDTRGDGVWDCLDHYDQGHLVRQERFSPAGTLEQVTEFDAKGQPVRLRRDTTGDTKLDTTHHYDKGVISRTIVDANQNGVWESRLDYQAGVLSLRQVDADQDGQPEAVFRCDAKGMFVESDHDLDRDKRFETFRFYDGRYVTRQERRAPDQSLVELTLYSQGLPQRKEMDTTRNGQRDLVTFFEQGQPVRQEQDTNGNGRVDTYRYLDKQGAPREIHQDTTHNGHIDSKLFLQDGTVIRTQSDEDHDNRLETTVTYQSGVRHRLERDTNGDGRVDHREHYAKDGSCQRMETDRNKDGRMDAWQRYENGHVALMETSDRADTRVDLRAWFKNGKKTRLERDTDGDGRFETVQHYDFKGWDMVLTQDMDGNGQPEAKLHYRQGLLREKQLLLPDGDVQSVEYFDAKGQLEKSRERESKGLSLTWFYDAEGNAVRAERDKDLDGQAEEFFSYENGTIRQVCEDTNADGRIDLWEDYDATGKLVTTSQDLDFDGTPDLVKGRKDQPLPDVAQTATDPKQ